MAKNIQEQRKELASLQQLGAFLADWELTGNLGELATLASSQGIGPLFLHRLKEAGIKHAKYPELQPLVSAARQVAVRYMLQERVLFEVNTTLTEAGIKPVWLKGAVLTHTLYPQPTLRPMVDLDVIVAQDEFSRALSILQGQGFSLIEETLSTPASKFSHHAKLISKEYKEVYLELHRKLLGSIGEKYLPAATLARWLKLSIVFEIGSTDFHMLKPEFHFLYVFAHAFLQHRDVQISLRQLLDLHLIATNCDLDWKTLVHEAIGLGWAYPLLQAIEKMVSIFNTSVPESVIASLKSQPVDEGSQLANLIKYNDVRAESNLTNLSQLTFVEALQTIQKMIFPPRRYMREHYNIPKQRPVLLYYFWRWFDQSRGLTIALYRRFALYISKQRRR